MRKNVAAATALLAAAGLLLAPAAAHAVEAGDPGVTNVETVTDASLEWGYSAYAQTGVMTPWQMGASGPGLEIVQRPGDAVSGDPAEAGRSYNVARFSGGVGEIDTATGAGQITWESDAQWSVQVTAPMGTPPAMLLSSPILSIAADGSGDLSFEVGATAGSSMGGAPSPEVAPARVVTQTFTSVQLEADGNITAIPDFAGVNSGYEDQVSGGGAWPASYLTQLPESVRAFHYQTSLTGLNTKKGGLPVHVATGVTFESVDTGGTDAAAEPTLELFDAAGNPLGDSEVREGDLITFKGSGFDPEANNPAGDGSGLPLPNNVPQGVFIAFGSVASPWQPSQGAPAENRTQVRTNTKWALLDRVVDSLAEPLKSTIKGQAVTHNNDGTFEGSIIAATPAKVPATGSFGVYTYAGGATVTNAAQELFVPVNFATTEDEPPAQPQAPTTGSELVWGFKESWRGYVAGIAQGTATPGTGARIDDQGLFHFALEDASGFNEATREGTIKYDGRIRFMSSAHGWDIVIEKPWVTLTDGGTRAVLSLGLSTTSTVGDLTVSRVDAATLTPASATSAVVDGVSHLIWSEVAGTFEQGLQPSEFQQYAGTAIDPVSFGIPALSVDDPEDTVEPEDTDEPEGDDTPGVNTEGKPSAAPGAQPSSQPGTALASSGTTDAGLAHTGAKAQTSMFAVAGALLAGGLLLTVRRRAQLRK